MSLAVVGRVEGRDLKLVVEGDFYGANNGYPPAPRLRPVRRPARRPDLDDVHGRGQHPEPRSTSRRPGRSPLVRQGLVRLTFDLSKRTLLAFGIEESDPRLLPPAWSGGNDGEGTAGLHGPAPVHGRPGARPAFDVRGPDALSAHHRRSDRRYDRGGDGLGPFPRLPPGLGLRPDLLGPGSGPIPRRLGASCPTRPAGCRPSRPAAFLVGYQHYWTSRWSSNVVVSRAWLGKRPGRSPRPRPPLRLRRGDPRYRFIENRAWAGVEYLYGRKEVRSGEQGPRTASSSPFA